jgi:4-amino-4-deoxy-L-arabinose transferase-like glycosyltransferase
MTLRQHLLLALIVIPLALAVRWYGGDGIKGAWFHPRPDSLEYAAMAQSLAQSGQVYLQIGPHRVRSRYPPGWPLLLAPAVKLGMAGQDLWKVTGLFGAGLSWLLAVLAAWAAAALSGRAGPAALAAGLLAGIGWALAPIALDLGRTLMSDEPNTLVSLLGLVLTGVAFLRKAGNGRLLLAAAAGGGLALGLALSMRTVNGALLAPPVLVFLVGGARRLGTGVVLRRGLAWAAGGLLFPTLTVAVLVRSGLPAWEWSGYRFWAPQRFEELTNAFHPRYALTPNEDFSYLDLQRRPFTHLELAGRVLLGLPGLRPFHYLGFYWPLAGWLAALPLIWLGLRRKGSGEVVAAVASALTLWTVGHVAVFSLYFYPTSRFYLAPLALCLVLLATACGVGLARPELRVRIPAGAVAVIVALLAAGTYLWFSRLPSPRLQDERTVEAFSQWMQLDDEERADRQMPFNPVYAQALGLLTPEVTARIQAWGGLPDTRHVRRLRLNGYLSRPGKPAPPARVRIAGGDKDDDRNRNRAPRPRRRS